MNKCISLVLLTIFVFTSCSWQDKKTTPAVKESDEAQTITGLEKKQNVKLKDPIDSHWLPDLTGLPSLDELIAVDEKVQAVMSEDSDKSCLAVNPRLRTLFFEHFLIYQSMANAQNIFLDENTIDVWSHVMAMTLKESDGDSTNVTDMQGHAYETHKGYSSLDRWNNILNLSSHTNIQMNYQTNFGLTQTSSDRLFLAFKLAQEQKEANEFLNGIEVDNPPNRVALDSAIAIRRMVWFYQDFAEGRISQEDRRIEEEDIDKPEYSERYHQGLEAAMRYCGTKYMFAEGYSHPEKIKDAFASIAYCKLGNAKQGYGNTTLDAQCFARIVTLCPALNIDIATITPPKYFATRNAAPICRSTFKRLLNKEPNKILKFFKKYEKKKTQ